MDKVERVMKMVKRMSPSRKRKRGGEENRLGKKELEDNLCEELCRVSLSRSGEMMFFTVCVSSLSYYETMSPAIIVSVVCSSSSCDPGDHSVLQLKIS